MSHRAGHSSVVYGKKLLIFGGQRYKQGGYNFLNDFYEFNAETNEWNSIKCSGEIPEERSQHNSLIYKDTLFIIGGHNSDVLFNDIYTLNLKDYKWKKIELQGMPKKVSISNGRGNVSNMFAAQFSSFIIKSNLYIYGLCGEIKLKVFDLESKEFVDEKKSLYGGKYSCSISISEKQNFHLF